MTHEEDGAAFMTGNILHLADGFFLELGIADGQDFIDDEDFRFHESGHGEAQTDGHARGVAFDGGVDVTGHAGEVDDVVELAVDFLSRHAHDRAVHVDVLAACHLGVESGAHF
jgi:hypothetical protein